MSFSQSLRWSGKGIGISRQRLLIGSSQSRHFSINATLSNRRNSLRSSSRKGTNPLLATQQHRSLSLFGWGSSSSSSKSTDEFNATHSPSQSPATATVDPSITVKASHATSDAADPAILRAQPVSEIEPPALQAIEDAITKPAGELPEVADLASIPENIGYLKNVCGLDYGWGPTAFIEFCVEHLHIYSGLSWATSICIFVLVARSVILRRVMVSSDQNIKVRSLQPVLKPLRAELTQALAANDKVKAMQVNNEIKAITKESGVKMTALLAPILLQLPIQFGGYRFLRGAGSLPVPGFETESWLWHTNLAMADPWILPAVTAACNYYSLKSNIESGSSTLPQSVLSLMKYGLPFVSFIFIHYQPAAVQIFFFLNSFFSLGQSYFVRNQTVRNYFRLAPMPVNIVVGSGGPAQPSPGGMNRVPTRTSNDASQTVIDVTPNERSWIDKAVDSFKDQRDSALKNLKDTKTTVMGDAGERLKKQQDDRRKQAVERYEYKRRQDLQVEREYRNRSRTTSATLSDASSNPRVDDLSDEGSGPAEVAGMKTTSAFRKQRKSSG